MKVFRWEAKGSASSGREHCEELADVPRAIGRLREVMRRYQPEEFRG